MCERQGEPAAVGDQLDQGGGGMAAAPMRLPDQVSDFDAALLDIPAGDVPVTANQHPTTSTVIFTSADAPPFSPVSGAERGFRSNQFGFYNNSLSLAAGLNYVDDLPATSQYRWATFNTFDQGSAGWLMGDNAAMYGGVNPSRWTDSHATAADMSHDLNVLSTLFTNKGTAGANATIYSGTDALYSYTNGRIVATLFRIHNTTNAAITWTPSFCYSQFSG